MRFKFDPKKSELLKSNPKRRIGFEEVQEIWEHPYYEDYRSDEPEQFRAIGWVKGKLYSVIYEIREDDEGEYYHLVTLWKSTSQEVKLYEENVR
ncbi:MAG: BrnT family toxin [Spirochaetota bacterium]